MKEAPAANFTWAKVLVTVLIGVALTWLLTAQAVSSAVTKSDPGLAASIFQINGAAQAQRAFDLMQSDLVTDAVNARSGAPAAMLARQALRLEPLETKAHVVLALRQSDADDRWKVVDLSSQLNRRNLALRGLVLTQYLEAEDYDNSIVTLDQILRVHPQYSSEFFPILTNTFARTADISAFADLLDGSSPWHDRFLAFAVRQSEALPNLARLRPQLQRANEVLDKPLIARLVAEGQTQDAFVVYQEASTRNAVNKDRGKILWQTDYPPFDWLLADEAGFRAQLGRSEEALDIFVRSGKGGTLASILMPKPNDAFSIEIKHGPLPERQADDVRLKVICYQTKSVLLEESFSKQSSIFDVNAASVDCPYVTLEILGRAWSGSPDLAFTITTLSVRR